MIREPHIDIHFSLVHAGHAIMLFGGCIALLAFTCLPPVLFTFCIFAASGVIASFGAWVATLESGAICTEPAGAELPIAFIAQRRRRSGPNRTWSTNLRHKE